MLLVVKIHPSKLTCIVSPQLAPDDSESDRSASPTPTPSTIDDMVRNTSPLPEVDLLNLNNSSSAPISNNSRNAPPVNLLDIDNDVNNSASNFDLLSNPPSVPLIGMYFVVHFFALAYNGIVTFLFLLIVLMLAKFLFFCVTYKGFKFYIF